jgi:hypothetical protein
MVVREHGALMSSRSAPVAAVDDSMLVDRRSAVGGAGAPAAGRMRR